MGFSMTSSEFKALKNYWSDPRRFTPLTEADVGAHVGTGPTEDDGNYHEDGNHFRLPICHGHYNHCYLHNDAALGMWVPVKKEFGYESKVELEWRGNIFEITRPDDCMMCIDVHVTAAQSIPPLSQIDITLKR